MHNSFKKICFCLVIILSFKAETTQASHALGSEFSYSCLGSNIYQIKYTLYRSCFGIVPNDSIDLSIYNDCGFASTVVYIFKTGSEIDISSTCPTSISDCFGGSYFGVQKWTYQGIINLPGECEWTISHLEASRVAALTTILGAGTDPLYTYCKINNISGLCNNSPVFTNDPIINFCVGQRFSIRNNTFDVEGDSISFEMIAPRTGLNLADTVTFYSSYSSQLPFMASYISFDPATGELAGIATQNDFTLAAFLVKEYRNGILIGVTERDMIIIIENCNNFIPFLTGTNGTGNFTINVYPNQQNCFFVASLDFDVNNTTTIFSTTNLLSGMTMTNSNGQRDSVFICWSPTLADTLSTFCFDLNVNDDNCPYEGKAQGYYCMRVMNSVDITNIENDDFKVWPNPFVSKLNISFSDNFNLPVMSAISIFDQQGRKLKNQIMQGTNQLDLNDLEAGIYFLSLNFKNSKHEFYKKIIKE